jgi:antitoxin component YwqK of YwqJK toxin-antitoxin module
LETSLAYGLHMLDPQEFQKNIDRWSLFYPDDADSLSKLKPTTVEFCNANNGAVNLKTTVDGVPCYYHSTEDPAAEADQWFNSLDMRGINALFVFGVGLGYYYDSAKKWLSEGENHSLVFCEQNLEVIYCLLQTARGKEILNDPKVWITFLDSRDINIDSLTSTFLLQRYLVTSLGLYERLYPSLIPALKSKLAFYMNIRTGLLAEYSDYGRAFFENLFRNILLLPQSNLGTGLCNQFMNIPAIICGAGPSMAKSLPIIKKLRDRALIFAGGTAMNALNTGGVLPHFGIGIDPNLAHFTRLIMNQAFEIPYFYRYRMRHEAVKTIHGPHLFVPGSTGYQIWEFFEEKLGIPSCFLSEGFNVINFSLSVAHALGCNPIIFVGVDLAYTDSLSYCPGIINHPLHERRKYFGTKTTNDELVSKPDIFGNPILTLWKWITESIWFARFAMANPRMLFLNATEGGIGFQGVPNVSLEKIEKTLLVQGYDLEGMIHAAIQEAVLPKTATENAIIDSMKELLESLKKCFAQITEMREDFEQSITECKKDESPVLDLPAEKEIKALYALESEPAYKYLLKGFDDAYRQIYSKNFQRLHIDAALMNEREKSMKRLLLDEGKCKFLYESCRLHINTIETILKEQADSANRPPAGPFDEQAKENPHPGESYSYEGEKFVLIDPEMNIRHEEFFSGKEEESLKYYYPEGGLRMEQYRQEGLLHGPSKCYSREGNLLTCFWFIKGKRQGKGRLYYRNGAIASIQRFLEGDSEGRQVYYYPSGQVKSIINYSKGILDGFVKLYYPSGQLKRELHFRDGKRKGFDRLWNEDGVLVIEAEFDADVPVNVARKWFANGNLAVEVITESNSYKYVTRQWNEHGELLASEHGSSNDYFDQVAKQTVDLTQSLSNVFDQMQTAIPLFDQLTERLDKEALKPNLESLTEQIHHLNEINQKLLFETGLDPANQQEAIWKMPSSKSEMERQIEEMTAQMSQEISSLQKALNETLDKFSKKIDDKEQQ